MVSSTTLNSTPSLNPLSHTYTHQVKHYCLFSKKVTSIIPRMPASLDLSDLSLPLPLAFPLPLLFDLVKGQDVFPVLAGGLAITTLGALQKVATFHNHILVWISPAAGETLLHFKDTYPLFALGFHADDGLSFGFVHNYGPLIPPWTKNILKKNPE